MNVRKSSIPARNFKLSHESPPKPRGPSGEQKRLVRGSTVVASSRERDLGVRDCDKCPDCIEPESEHEQPRYPEQPTEPDADKLETEKWLAPFLERASDILEHRAQAFPATNERAALVRKLLPSWNIDDILGFARDEIIAWFQSLEQGHRTARVSPQAARRFYSAGIALLVQKIPQLELLAADVARVLGFPATSVRCSLFCNRRAARTLAHFDSADTLTVQITGSKTWRIAPNEHVRLPMDTWGHPDVPGHELRLYMHEQFPPTMPDENVESHRLEPGAMLYVPRGHWHETESSEESVSLHIQILPRTWADVVLKTLHSRLLRDESWRATAYRLWGLEREGDWDAAKALEALREVVGTLTPEDVHRPAPWTPTPDDCIAPRARGSVGVVASAKDYKSVRLTSEEFALEHATTVQMSPSYLRATLLVADGPDPLSAKDLAARVPDLSVDEALELVRLLCDVGYARRASAFAGV
ncbi:cupin domain-containing protein [Pendulispora rubella]|uniref:Cupin domain-containing protein n=1 Tax=Pendulispora rubella TaxID=2741070 RepID=A0ABZ2L041_9BACT